MYTLLTKRFAPRSVVSRTSMAVSTRVSLSTPWLICSASCPAWARVAHTLSTKLGDLSVLGSAVLGAFRSQLAGARPEVQFVGALTATAMYKCENWHVGCSLDAARRS